MASLPITTDEMVELGREHGLVAVSCSLLADIGKFSVSIQWMSNGFRECSSGIEADPREALEKALAGKLIIDNRTDDEKAERVADLRKELEALTGEPA